MAAPHKPQVAFAQNLFRTKPEGKTLHIKGFSAKCTAPFIWKDEQTQSILKSKISENKSIP